jgi:hypothetical protein
MEENIESIIPDYIKDEIEKYKWKKKNGNSGVATYDNIKSLLGLAIMNKRITREQADQIMKLVDEI